MKAVYVRNAAAFDHTVYEAGGFAEEPDVAGGQIQPISIHLELQSIQARPQWKDASKNLTSAHLSPTGKRVLDNGTRRHIFSVPVKDGRAAI